MQLGQAVTRKFFDSSVYRNILDMISTLETIRGELSNKMLIVARSYSTETRPIFINGEYKGDERNRPGPAANGFAYNKGSGRSDWLSFLSLVGKEFDMQIIPKRISPIRRRLGQTEVEGFPTWDKADAALLEGRFQVFDLKARIRNLEWELNRVHLPMPKDLRGSLVELDKYVAELQGKGVRDKQRIGAYNTAVYMKKLKVWLAEMTEVIQKRLKEDQTGLARIVNQRKTIAQTAAAAGDTKKAIVEEKKAAVVEKKIADTVKTETEAAKVVEKIAQPDQPETEKKNTGLVVVGTLAAGAMLLM